jgi:phosphatidylglycerol---prolipoprotein diacylglyceryl transferase
MNFFQSIRIEYAVPVLIALLISYAYPIARFIPAGERRKYWILQTITLLGAIVGAKIVVMTGDRFWPVVPIGGWREVLECGRSIVGGLIFGFLTAEAAKPLLDYKLPPNDRFAAILPFSIGIGRIGCFLAGCCRGVAHEGMLSVTYADGIPRYPAQLFEAAFHFATGIAFLILVRRGVLKARIFAVYLIAYGIFRFLTEFIRETPRAAGDFSVYQFWCVLMIALGIASYAARTERREAVERTV